MYMLRHYDMINWGLTKFSFGQILVVVGACWTILNQGREANETLWDVYNDGMSNYIVGAVLLLSACFVFLTLVAILKNRTYFVLMSRYLNEHRDNAIKDNPFGFINKTEMWHDYKFPAVLDWKSTQMVGVYLFVICFVFLLFVSLYSLFLSCGHVLCLSLVVTLLSSFVGFGMCYKILK